MIYSFISRDPDNYGTIYQDINIPKTDDVIYYVSDINFQNYLVTTKDDFIIFEYPDEQQTFKYTFPDKSDYDEDTLVSFLNTLFNNEVKVTKNNDGTLRFQNPEHSVIDVYFATHRVELLLGLIHYMPLSMSFVLCTECPNCNLGNMMFLNSFEAGSPVITSDEYGRIIGSSTIYIINQFTRPNLPVIVKNKHKLMKRSINPYSLTHISFQLCDKYNVPIVLRSPMSVSITVI
jgi:hypothetical protein